VLTEFLDFPSNTWRGKYSLTNEAYHAAPGISASSLHWLEESPVHFDNKHLFRTETKSLNFGSLVHALILEEDLVNTDYAIMPTVNLRTAQGKDDLAFFEQSNQSKIIINQADYDKALVMKRNVTAICGNLFDFSQGEAESAFFAEDDGLLLKCKPDFFMPDYKIVVDIKTIADASEGGIRPAIRQYRYDWASVFYPKVLGLLGFEVSNFVFVFVESTPPHTVKVRVIDGETLFNATNEVNFMLDKYRQYKEDGVAELYKVIKVFGN